jgi:predicted DsbA family dithiol-disulfide isomerase
VKQGTRAAMKIRSGRMERPLFDENGNLNKDAVLADASKYEGLDGRKLPTEKEGMKMAKNMSDEEFEVRDTVS